MQSEAQQNSTLHAWSAGGFVMLIGVVALVGWAAGEANIVGCKSYCDLHPQDLKCWVGPDLDQLEAIEASLAYKKAPPKAQPQKQRKAPDPVTKTEGVSRDADKKPLDKPPDDEPKSKIEDEDPLAKFRRKDQDEDLETGKVVDPVGDFRDDKFGFAEETKGDPYFQDLIGDLLAAGGDYPTLADAEGVPIGCLHLDADGKIVDTLFKEKSGNDELDDFVERSLKGLKKQREEHPVPVPEKLLSQISRWICFKFSI